MRNLISSLFTIASFAPIMTSRALFASAKSTHKHLWIVRHGQATHNPRAEIAKEAGCSHEEFLELMRQDDALDAELTELGEHQAASVGQNCAWDQLQLQLVVSSPLSRAIRTADLVAPPTNEVKRVSIEGFREINGWLLNAKRRHVSELSEKFPAWDFGQLTLADTLWTKELEADEDCAERGYLGLHELIKRPEERILLCCHGGILRFTMQLHPLVQVNDEREKGDLTRPSDARFGNCEIRKYKVKSLGHDDSEDGRPTLFLTEVDMD